MDLSFILAVSNICQPILCLAGSAIETCQEATFPANIEYQHFLNVNTALQDISDVHDVEHENISKLKRQESINSGTIRIQNTLLADTFISGYEGVCLSWTLCKAHEK